MRLSLKQKLSYARFGQISLVFVVGLGLYLFTTIPHNWWIFLTVMMMSAAMEPGLIVKKSINRGKGTLIGIILFLPLIYLMHLNYRVIPLVFILLGLGISLPNARRYDISVVFMTIMVFTLTAYTFTTPLLEGPFEMMLNRGVCTVIGIIICLSGDYFLFGRFNYSRKVYFLLQHEVCRMLESKLNKICSAGETGLNPLLLVEDLRDSFNQSYSSIATSAESIRSSLTNSKSTKTKVVAFELILWQLRKVVFGVYYAECVLKDPASSAEHQQRFRLLMTQARQNMISLRD